LCETKDTLYKRNVTDKSTEDLQNNSHTVSYKDPNVARYRKNK